MDAKTPPDAGRMPDEETPGRRFAYEMAFDSRFEGRRWDEVETELRAEYPRWMQQQGLDRGGADWDGVKHAVREAWDSALDVERAKTDPWSGQWDERAPEYRRMWESRYSGSGRRWEDVELGYRYADSMGLDPRYLGRPWDDVAPGLEVEFPTWAASHGYRIGEGENLWERLRDSIRHAWDHVKHRRPS